eukprot:jgi/Antlo1/550/985
MHGRFEIKPDTVASKLARHTQLSHFSKKNFKSSRTSGTKSAALSGYSLVAKRKLPKL